MKLKKKIVYIVKQYYSDGMPYSEIYGDDLIAVCETKEIAEQIAKQQDAATLKGQFNEEDWDKWIIYRDEHYIDPDDEYYCIFDKDEYDIDRSKELKAAIEFFSSLTEYTEKELVEKIKAQWDYIDNSFYEYHNCEISEITMYVEDNE